MTSGCSRKGPFTFILFMYYNAWKVVTFPWDLLLTQLARVLNFQTLPHSDLSRQLGASSMKAPFMKNSGDMHILGCCGWACGSSQNTAALRQGEAPMSCLLFWILFPRSNASHGKSPEKGSGLWSLASPCPSSVPALSLFDLNTDSFLFLFEPPIASFPCPLPPSLCGHKGRDGCWSYKAPSQNGCCPNKGPSLQSGPSLASLCILDLLEGPTVVKLILEVLLCTFTSHSYRGTCHVAFTIKPLLSISCYT